MDGMFIGGKDLLQILFEGDKSLRGQRKNLKPKDDKKQTRVSFLGHN